jgi:hypothetical protein
LESGRCNQIPVTLFTFNLPSESLRLATISRRVLESQALVAAMTPVHERDLQIDHDLLFEATLEYLDRDQPYLPRHL